MNLLTLSEITLTLSLLREHQKSLPITSACEIDTTCKKLHYMCSELPSYVVCDLDNGYELTDIDDGFQRFTSKDNITFNFKANVIEFQSSEVTNLSSTICISDYSESELEDLSTKGYDSLNELRKELGDSSNQILAELIFEDEYPLGSSSPLSNQNVPAPSIKLREGDLDAVFEQLKDSSCYFSNSSLESAIIDLSELSQIICDNENTPFDLDKINDALGGANSLNSLLTSGAGFVELHL